MLAFAHGALRCVAPAYRSPTIQRAGAWRQPFEAAAAAGAPGSQSPRSGSSSQQEEEQEYVLRPHGGLAGVESEDLELLRALELSLLDRGAAGGGAEDRPASPEGRPQGLPLGLPRSTSEEEALLAEAIAESLRLQEEQEEGQAAELSRAGLAAPGEGATSDSEVGEGGGAAVQLADHQAAAQRHAGQEAAAAHAVVEGHVPGSQRGGGAPAAN
jgi:hypothetical protein